MKNYNAKDGAIVGQTPGVIFAVAILNFAAFAATPTTSLANQFRADNGAAIALGTGVVPAGVGVHFQCALNDADNDTIKLEVELHRLPASFSGTPTLSSGFVSSGTRAQTVAATGLAAGNYGWKYRAIDSRGAATAWSSAGNPDFIVGEAPNLNAPTIFSPGDAWEPGNTSSTTAITISWSGAQGALYEIYVSRRNQTTGNYDLVWDSSITGLIPGTSYTLPFGALPGDGYYRMNMRAKSAAGYSAFSERRFFKIQMNNGPILASTVARTTPESTRDNSHRSTERIFLLLTISLALAAISTLGIVAVIAMEELKRRLKKV